jgi:hypothetical protein
MIRVVIPDLDLGSGSGSRGSKRHRIPDPDLQHCFSQCHPGSGSRINTASHSLTSVLLCSLQFSDSDLEGGGGGPTLVRSTRNRLSRLHGLKKKKVRNLYTQLLNIE